MMLLHCTLKPMEHEKKKHKYDTFVVRFDGHCFEEIKRLTPRASLQDFNKRRKRTHEAVAYVKKYRKVTEGEEARFEGTPDMNGQLYWAAFIHGFEHLKKHRVSSLLKKRLIKSIEGGVINPSGIEPKKAPINGKDDDDSCDSSEFPWTRPFTIQLSH